MKNYFTIAGLLLLCISCASDASDATDKQTTPSSDTPKEVSVVIPKLPRTQDTTLYTAKYGGICCSLLDRSGNLWFGSTDEGLYRFDGTSFMQFTTNEGLSTNHVNCLFEDQLGNIWIGTSDGICKYNGVAISKVPIVVSDPSILVNPDKRYTNDIWTMLQDKQGKFWFCTSVGVFTYDGIKFSQFPNDYSVINTDNIGLKMVDDILEDKDGKIWFAGGMLPGSEGVSIYDGKTLTTSKPNGDGWIRTMTPTRQGTIWFGGRHNGVFTYNGSAYEIFTVKEKIGGALLEDRNGNIWFSGEEHEDGYSSVDGIWRYDPSAGLGTGGTAFTNYTTKDGLGNYGVYCAIEDAKGNIWFGTRNNGLYKFDGKSFICYSE